MVEPEKRFVGKESVVRTFNSSCFIGTIKVINLEFVVNIKEHPKIGIARKRLLFSNYKNQN